MPTYKIQRSWTETNYYSDEVEVEADSEDEAEDMARDEEMNYDHGPDDSDTNGPSIDKITKIDNEDEPQGRHKRKLPGWF